MSKFMLISNYIIVLISITPLCQQAIVLMLIVIQHYYSDIVTVLEFFSKWLPIVILIFIVIVILKLIVIVIVYSEYKYYNYMTLNVYSY